MYLQAVRLGEDGSQVHRVQPGAARLVDLPLLLLPGQDLDLDLRCSHLQPGGQRVRSSFSRECAHCSVHQIFCDHLNAGVAPAVPQACKTLIEPFMTTPTAAALTVLLVPKNLPDEKDDCDRN